MAKFEAADAEVLAIFEEVLGNTNIPHWVEIKVLENVKAKEMSKIQKLNDLVETLTDGLMVAIVINSKAFSQLPDDMKRVVFDEALAGVEANMESGKITLKAPDFCTHSGLLTKYGDSYMIKYKESIKSIFDKIKEEEDAEKAAKKEKKGGKRGRKSFATEV
jgi:TRAP-type mannitol/chloroaromatic compound transport system substrate-binding protein